MWIVEVCVGVWKCEGVWKCVVWGYVDVWKLVCVGVGVWRSEEVALMR